MSVMIGLMAACFCGHKSNIAVQIHVEDVHLLPVQKIVVVWGPSESVAGF